MCNFEILNLFSYCKIYKIGFLYIEKYEPCYYFSYFYSYLETNPVFKKKFKDFS